MSLGPRYTYHVRWFALLAAFGLCSVPTVSEARSTDDCKLQWSRAVRSYLPREKGKMGPDGNNPADLDGEELAAQAWLEHFAPACQLESDGEKQQARFEAARLGAEVLVNLHAPSCKKFMTAFMQSDRPKDVCDTISQKGDPESVRQMIADSIPKRE